MSTAVLKEMIEFSACSPDKIKDIKGILTEIKKNLDDENQMCKIP